MNLYWYGLISGLDVVAAVYEATHGSPGFACIYAGLAIFWGVAAAIEPKR